MIRVPAEKERPYFGATIDAQGQLRYTSVSQVVMFDREVEGGCERKWHYRYKKRIKELKVEGQKEGSDWGEKLEWYLKGQGDQLPAPMQRSKHYFPTPGPDLEVEEPLGDLARAIAIREAILKLGGIDKAPQAYIDQLWQFAGLVAYGIPFDGAADCRHQRGEYIGEDGNMYREPAGLRVIEILDHKATKQIDSYWTRGNKNLIRGYSKTAEEVAHHPQMVGYGIQAHYRHPEMTHARLSHVYTQRKGQHPCAAAKRTSLVPVSELRSRWHRVNGVVQRMTEIALVDKTEDVPYNTEACDTYSHVLPDGVTQAKGCMHRSYCPIPTQIATANLMGKESSTMSFFNLDPSAAPVVPAAPTEPMAAPAEAPPAPSYDAWRAEVDRQKMMFGVGGQASGVAVPSSPPATPAAAPSAPPPPPVVAAPLPPPPPVVTAASPAPVTDLPVLGMCGKCNNALTAQNTSKLRSGELFHVGCPNHAAASSVAQVNPADSPKMPLIDEADPMSAADIAEIGDPAARQRAEQHAADHAVRAQEQAAKKSEGKVSPWCPGGDQRISIDTETALARKYICQCGKPFTFKPEKLTKDESGAHVLEIKRHKKKDEPEDTTLAITATVAPTVAVSAPQATPDSASPPPPPPVIAPPPPPMLVQTGRTSYDGMMISNPPRTGNGLPPAPPAPPAPPPAVTQVQGLPPLPPLPPPEPIINGLMVFVDVRAERGPALTPLEDYYARFVRGMEQLTGSRDVRTAEKNTPLAFGGWKGYLAAYCRAEPPVPGRYFARGTDEFAMVVLEAIGNRCEAVFRG